MTGNGAVWTLGGTEVFLYHSLSNQQYDGTKPLYVFIDGECMYTWSNIGRWYCYALF